jgi:hypothetical protein
MVDMMFAVRTFVPSADCSSAAFAMKELRTGDGNRRGGGLTAISRINKMSTTDGRFTESLMTGIVQKSGPEVVAGLDDFLQKKSWRLEVSDRGDVIDATRVHNW